MFSILTFSSKGKLPIKKVSSPRSKSFVGNQNYDQKLLLLGSDLTTDSIDFNYDQQNLYSTGISTGPSFSFTNTSGTTTYLNAANVVTSNRQIFSNQGNGNE